MRKLQEKRFHRMDLLELLLDEGEAAVGEDPEKGRVLAALAVCLGSLAGMDCRELRPRLVRAFCLEANAHRLEERLADAATALNSAQFFLPGSPRERALYYRELGLLRWEQGGLEEAAALLRHAAQAWAEEGHWREQGVCLVLLGLLHVETEDFSKAAGPLARGLSRVGGRASRQRPRKEQTLQELEDHPEPEQIESFLRGDGDPATNQSVVRHLLQGCAECQKHTLAAWYRNDAPWARPVLVWGSNR